MFAPMGGAIRAYAKPFVPPLLFTVLAVLYCYNTITGEWVFSERDLAPFFIPPKLLWISLIKSGQLPLWNPYNYSGIPLFATLQPGILYPPHLLYLFLPFPVAWNWLIILHFALAGTTLYALLRYMKVSRPGAYLGGVIFMLSGYLLSVHNLQPHLFAVAWFPLTMLFYLKALSTGGKKSIVLAGLFLCMEFLSGAPEIVIMTILVLVLTAVFPDHLVESAVSWRVRGKVFALLMAVFLLLAAVQLIPFYELKRESIRSSGLSYAEAVTWSFAWKDFIQFFMPDAYGYLQNTEKYWHNQSWLKTVYLGVAPFILSIFYFVCSGRKRWYLVGLMVLSIFFALGGNTPFYKYLHLIPPFNSVRFPVKFLFLFFFLIALTAGMGLDTLVKGVEGKDKRTVMLVQTMFYTGFVFAVCWGAVFLFDGSIRSYLDQHLIKPPAYNEIWFNLHNVKRLLLFTFVLCMMLLICLRVKSNRNVLIGSMVCLVAVDLFLANLGFYSVSPWKWFISRDGFVKILGDNRETERYFVTSKTDRELEYVYYGKTALTSPYASMFGLYSTGGSEVMKVLNQENFIAMVYCGRTVQQAGRFFDVAGVRYLTTSYSVEGKDFRLIRKENMGKATAYLYEYIRYPGRFLIYGRAHIVGDDKTAIRKLTDDGVDLRRNLIILDPARAGKLYESDARGQARLVSYQPNSVVLESESNSDAFLYLSDTWYPGWRAYVDGKETRIYRANLAFRAVEVPKGRHTVLFRYVPVSFYAGLFLTCLGILLCIRLWRKGGRDADGEEASETDGPHDRESPSA